MTPFDVLVLAAALVVLVSTVVRAVRRELRRRAARQAAAVRRLDALLEPYGDREALARAVGVLREERQR